MHWQRLDRDNSIKVIDSVKSDANAGLFSAVTSEVKRAHMPFYKGYYLYKVTNFASLPSFSFQYLSDGTFFHYLDGTEEPIHAVNDKNALVLSAQNIMSYLAFYFEQVGDDEGDVTVINNPHDMPLLDSLDHDAYHAVITQHQIPEIKHDEAENRFTIHVDLYSDSQIVRAVIDINKKGRVTVKEQKAAMQEVANPIFSNGQ